MGLVGEQRVDGSGRVIWRSGLRRASAPALDELGQTIRRRLDYEVGRARRYGGRVTLVAFQAASITMPTRTWQHFSTGVAASLRDLDTCWIGQDRITVILPETDVAARAHVVDRVLAAAELEGLVIEPWASTFPDEAATTDALIRSVTGTGDARTS